MTTVLLLSTADTDLLAARAAATDTVTYRVGNPSRVDAALDLPALLDGADLAVVRLLGGRRIWEEGLAALAASGVPTVLLGGESVPDAELMAMSSVPAASSRSRCATWSRAARRTSRSWPASCPTPC